MGTFTVSIEIGNLAGSRFSRVTALVDTGTACTTLPASILTRLGISQEGFRRFQLADNRIVEYPVGHVRMCLEGQEIIALVVFAPEGADPQLGATALEIFSLAVDQVNQRLVSVPALLKSPLLMP